MDNQSFSLEEKMIPVLTVMKNNAILKNIFLLSSGSAVEEDGSGVATLVVGRHPDCDLSLSHPSISRFHLRILSNPSARSLSVVDLSSVHGTWVMGKKIKPNLQVELNQGDTMQIGGSSRVYRLDWVPLSRVYDIENPFVSPSYVSEQAEEDKDQEGTLEDENGIHENSRVQLLDDNHSEGLDCEFSDEKSRLSLSSEIPSGQPFSEEDVQNKSIADKELKSRITSNSFSELLNTESDTETTSWFDEILSETEIQRLAKDQKSSQKLLDTESEQNLDFHESLASLYPEEYSENPGSTKFNLFSEIEIQQLDNESQSQNMGTPPESNSTSMTDQEKKMSPSIFSEKLVTEPEISSFYDEITLKNQNQQFKEERGTPLESSSISITDQEKKMSPSIISEELVTESEMPPESNSTSMTDQEKKMSPSIFSEKLVTEPEVSPFYDEITSRNQNQQFKEERGAPLERCSISITDQEKKMCPSIFSEELVTESEISSFSDEFTLKNQNQQFKEEKASLRVLLPIELEQNADSVESLPSLFSHEPSGHSYSPDIKLLPEVESQQVKKENESREVNLGTPLVKLGKQFSSSIIRTRRCKPCVLTIQTGRRSEMNKGFDLKFDNDSSDPGDNENNEVIKSPFAGLDATEEAFTPDKENCIPNTLALDLVRYNSCSMENREEISKNLFPGLNENNEQFTPDKENMTPNPLLRKPTVRMSRMKENNVYSLCVSSSLEHTLCPSIKEKPALKILQEWKLTRSSSRSRKVMKRKSGTKSSAKRVPFQTLFEYSSSMSKSEASALSSTIKSCNTMKHAENFQLKGNVKEDEKKWHMIVDTNCLLKRGSRMALQLLQGLKGTQMIIPKIVIRELDSMNRQGSLFRRTEASCALQWIKECMENTDWWIQVQSSEEEDSRPIAPTSPTISESRFCKVYRKFTGGAASSVVTAWQTLFEIVSPTAQGHVLECALQFKGNKSDGRFVLLSNDSALKIKAMAEGLICETAQEFRDSLVNPFSDRFLWSESSPRGLTWSCKDDIILKEKFYEHSMKLGGGERAKGLQLILLHNACYAHTSLVS